MHTRFSIFVVASLLFFPVLTLAGESATTDLGGSLLQLVLGFGVVLALLFATLWLLKKISLPRGGSGNMIRVVSAAAVGPRERVVLVDVGGKRLVLGVAPGQVSLLDTQVSPTAAPTDTAAREPIEGVVATPMFAQWLKQTLAKRNGK
jgi:flagellar protein FliO/FliZ